MHFLSATLSPNSSRKKISGRNSTKRKSCACGPELPETVNSYTQSMYVHNRTLYVRLSSAVLRNELTMLRNELLTRINAEFGHRVIDNIIFR